MRISYLILALACTKLTGAAPDVTSPSSSVNMASANVTFDMDPAKEGLDYLNYDEEYLASRPHGSAGALAGVGAGRAESYEDREASVPLLLRPLMASVFVLRDITRIGLSIAMVPISIPGRATEIPQAPAKLMTNRPVGRPGEVVYSARELSTYSPQRFAASEEDDGLEEIFGHVTTIDFLQSTETVQAYEVDLPAKENTNRPRGRAGASGRGNSRQLYQAQPGDS